MTTAVKKVFKATPNKVKNPASLNENARKLVRALRNEKNKRCVGYLCKINKTNKIDTKIKSNCVLGLACELYIKSGGRLNVKIVEKLDSNYNTLTYDGHEYELPPKVQRWLGFTTPDGGYSITDDSESTLIEDNDDSKMSFKKLANLIESKPKNLFRKGY